MEETVKESQLDVLSNLVVYLSENHNIFLFSLIQF